MSIISEKWEAHRWNIFTKQKIYFELELTK